MEYFSEVCAYESDVGYLVVYGHFLLWDSLVWMRESVFAGDAMVTGVLIMWKCLSEYLMWLRVVRLVLGGVRSAVVSETFG